MFTSKEIASVTNGVLKGADAEITSISTDTRTIEKGALFVAVKGENFDGNDFIDKAFENGAACALTDVKNGLNVENPVIYVENSRIAQLKLARYYRDKFGVKICGVTGSVGKTSTKDMIYAVLSAKYPTLKTEGNLNNDIGLPKTLFRLDESFKAAVIEMGMDDLGQISALSETVHPNCAVITNIGWCHIENLKTRENILKAKLEILDGMDNGSPLIINGDDEMLKTVEIDDRKVVRYGFNANNDIYADNIVHTENGEKFTLHYDGRAYPAEVPVKGGHHIMNALAAFCVGIEFNMTAEEIIPAFMNYEASGMRQRIEKRGEYTLILDCYNASPTSMESSLSVLGTMNGRKAAVLGDMLELGEMSKTLHEGLADAVEKNADIVFLYGKEMKALRDELFRREFPVFHSENKYELTELLLQNLKKGDNVLLKGSRGMKMEEIADKIK